MGDIAKQGVGREIDFNCPPACYWDEAVKISYLQRRIIVHSIIYYVQGSSVITDQQFDALSRQLVRMQKEASEEELKKSTYYYAMYDFDGSTGFDLYDRLNEHDKEYLMQIANIVRGSRGAGSDD